MCEKCVQRVENRQPALLERVQKAKPLHEESHSYVRMVIEETDGP